MDYIDILTDLQYGDSGKGKCVEDRIENGDYTHILKSNGSSNSGRTLYKNGKKIIIHSLPSIPRPGVKLIVGSGCVLNVKQFLNELEEVKEALEIEDPQVFVAKNTHIITDEHIEEDSKDTKIGTTKQGNGPCYRDKYDRTGIRAEDVPELEPYLIDIYEELFVNSPDARVLAVVVQGFGLDIDHGDYPYVTSSHTHVAGCLLNGIPYNKIRNVTGIAKVYETYVGTKDFEGDDPIFPQIREMGKEYGATTGRPRAVNWLDIDLLKRAATINGVDTIIFNKADILLDLGEWAIRNKNGVIPFGNELSFIDYIKEELPKIKLIFSYSPEKI